jgi:hypothetical protein
MSLQKEEGMKRSRLSGLGILILFLLLGCQIAQLFASDPTPLAPLPTQTQVVNNTLPSPTAEPATNAPTPPPPAPTLVPSPVPTLAPTLAPIVTELPTQVVQQPTAPPPPPPGCSNPNTAITSPAMNSTVSGLIEIRGTAARQDMQYWKVEYRTEIATDYVTLNRSEKAITDDALARLSTKTLPGNGVYFIRLVIVQKDGNFGAPCEIRINVQN